MDSPRGIAAHRARVTRRRELSKSKGKSLRNHNAVLQSLGCNRRPWSTNSISHKGELGPRRNRLRSAVAEPPLLDDGDGHYYTSNGTGRVLKKNTLGYQHDPQAWQDEEEGGYDRVYTEPVPCPAAPTATHTPAEWDASYREMVEQKHQDELAKVQEELVCQKRLYDDMASHARDTVLALDQRTDKVVELRDRGDYWIGQYEEEKVHRAADVERNYRQLGLIIQLEKENKRLIQRMENRDSVRARAAEGMARQITQLEEENRQLLQRMEMIHNLATD